ncbi:MAG: prepilin-type N-terminal cleavage/methylation domain-containing protein, partial [Candidatus Omnitrophica bacterium]|nr:prepilin-type N-terminal cleavage/methylation domain-containing protein [Candidatus Omnitrophota bacterium]
MLLGLSQYYKGKRGVTLIELIMSVLLLSIIFLAVSALYVSSQKFYYKAANESIIAEELSYAIEHISKTV